MRTDPKQSDENREEAGLEEALKLWMEIRQVDRKKGWERLEAEIGRQYGLRRQERRRRLGYFRWLAAAVILLPAVAAAARALAAAITARSARFAACAACLAVTRAAFVAF